MSSLDLESFLQWPVGLDVIPGLGIFLSAPVRNNSLVLLSMVAIQQQPRNASVAVGASTTFSLTTNDPGNLTYAWSLDGELVGGDAPAFEYKGLEQHVEGVHTVQCRVSHPLGLAVSDPVTLTVTRRVAPSRPALSFIVGVAVGAGVVAACLVGVIVHAVQRHRRRLRASSLSDAKVPLLSAEDRMVVEVAPEPKWSVCHDSVFLVSLLACLLVSLLACCFPPPPSLPRVARVRV